MKLNASFGSSWRFKQAGSLSGESLCSVAIAVWGWQTNLLFLALPMIGMLEARRMVQQRWKMSLNDLKEVAKLSGLILGILFVVIIITQKSLFIYTLLQWLPVAAFPLLVATTYGVGVLELLYDEFSNPYLLQKGSDRRRNFIDPYPIYFALCLLSASANDSEHFVFYGVAAGSVALLMWQLRPQRSTPALWLLLFCLAVGMGFAGHMQISQVQRQLQSQIFAMLSDLATGAVDPDGSATQMGSIGRLKLSNKIIARIAADSPATDSPTALSAPDLPATDLPSTDLPATDSALFPLLLREASYNRYQLATWTATHSIFVPVPPGKATGEWILAPDSPQRKSITISTNLERGDGILTLPQGTSRIQQLPVSEMQQNQYGVVQVDAVGNAAYQVRFMPDRNARPTESRPTEDDLQIPNIDKAAVEQTLQRLNLTGQSEREMASRIAASFQNFQYSLDLIRPSEATSPVSDFLLNTQTGHCEYFATATALMLRAVGIPARYVVGYSVHEFSPLERQYIVRSRDAHAWTLAYIDGEWQTFDTTPPDWRAQEQAMTSHFQTVLDLVAFLGFQGSLRVRQLRELGSTEIILLMTPLFGYLIWRSVQRFKGQRTITEKAAASDRTIAILRQGLDSELFEIEQQLSNQELQRLPAESFRQWKARVQAHLLQASFEGTMPTRSQWFALEEILELHYRYRFDPYSLSAAERKQLATLSQAWIDQR